LTSRASDVLPVAQRPLAHSSGSPRPWEGAWKPSCARPGVSDYSGSRPKVGHMMLDGCCSERANLSPSLSRWPLRPKQAAGRKALSRPLRRPPRKRACFMPFSPEGSATRPAKELLGEVHRLSFHASHPTTARGRMHALQHPTVAYFARKGEGRALRVVRRLNCGPTLRASTSFTIKSLSAPEQRTAKRARVGPGCYRRANVS
jgi:hypothetical protein